MSNRSVTPSNVATILSTATATRNLQVTSRTDHAQISIRATRWYRYIHNSLQNPNNFTDIAFTQFIVPYIPSSAVHAAVYYTILYFTLTIYTRRDVSTIIIYIRNGSVLRCAVRDRRMRRRYMDGDVDDRVKGLRVQGVT